MKGKILHTLEFPGDRIRRCLCPDRIYDFLGTGRLELNAGLGWNAAPGI